MIEIYNNIMYELILSPVQWEGIHCWTQEEKHCFFQVELNTCSLILERIQFKMNALLVTHLWLSTRQYCT